jgi:hypothetical protein
LARITNEREIKDRDRKQLLERIEKETEPDIREALQCGATVEITKDN